MDTDFHRWRRAGSSLHPCFIRVHPWQNIFSARIKRTLFRVALFAFSVCLLVHGAAAQDAVTPSSRFKVYGWIETGVTANPDDPATRQNFGHLFTDRPNELLLNQAVITAERTLGDVER